MIDLTYYYQQVLKNPTATPEAKAEAREKLGLSSTLEGTMGPHKIPEKAPLSRVGQLGKTISEYEKKYHPSEMTNFRELMQSSSRFAYDKRRGEQKMGFEPSQVSGQTFADIIGWAEQQRGAAVSDIYKTGVYGEVEEQKTIGDILEDLRKERDTLIDNRQQFIQKLASSSPRTLIALGGENIDSILSGADITPEVYQMIAEEAKEVVEPIEPEPILTVTDYIDYVEEETTANPDISDEALFLDIKADSNLSITEINKVIEEGRRREKEKAPIPTFEEMSSNRAKTIEEAKGRGIDRETSKIQLIAQFKADLGLSKSDDLPKQYSDAVDEVLDAVYGEKGVWKYVGTTQEDLRKKYGLK